MTTDFEDALNRLQVVIDNFQKNYSLFKDKYQRSRFKFQNKVEEQKERKGRISEFSENIELKKEALEVTNQIAEIFEEYSIRRKLEKVITSIIQTLFSQDNFEFVIFRKTMRNQQEVYLYKAEEREGHRFLIPLENEGGGICDIVDIIFRVLILQQCSKNQRFLILDEPMKNLSKELRPMFFDFFNKLCDEFEIRYLIVTHESEYMDCVDNKYVFLHDGEHTVVEKVEC